MHRPLLIGRGTLHAPEFRIIALPMRRHFNIARRAPAEYKAFLAELEKRAPLDRRDEFRTAIAHLGDVGPRNQRAQVMLNILLTIVEVDHDAACRALSRRRRILWQPRSAADPVVWIDMRKFNALWKRTPNALYITKRAGRVECRKFGRWLAAQPLRKRVEMPHIVLEAGTMFFSNGRRRLAWCRDHGVSALPVSMDNAESAREARRLFGSPLRTCALSTSAP